MGSGWGKQAWGLFPPQARTSAARRVAPSVGGVALGSRNKRGRVGLPLAGSAPAFDDLQKMSDEIVYIHIGNRLSGLHEFVLKLVEKGDGSVLDAAEVNLNRLVWQSADALRDRRRRFSRRQPFCAVDIAQH